MENPKAKIITAIGMFYDMEDPGKFIRDVAQALRPEGVFIAQLMTLKAMLAQNDVGNICHEHLEFYSYQSLKYLFEHNGLEIFKIEENTINGGSYRIFAKHYKGGSIDYPEEKPDYQTFIENINRNRKAVAGFIEQNKGKKFYGYGASTKGNTVLQWYGLDARFIEGIADPNPEKIGKHTVGTLIPIVSEEEARAKADYFFVLPYAFLDYFIEKEKEWLKSGGQFLVSTPEFRVYGA